MKKMLLMATMLIVGLNCANAQSTQAKQTKLAKIEFESLSYDFGTFSEANPVQECTFTFTNVGEAPLIITQAIASCGCTVPSYTKEPIAPGKKGEIKVTYNGKGKFPGHFKKSITVRNNGKPDMSRLYIEGIMEEAGK